MTMVFANFPVRDLEIATEFYTKLGFTMNEQYSDENASAMAWNDTFFVMLLTRDFYKRFIGNRQVADPKTTSGALVAFSLDSPEEVRAFAKRAQDNGGEYYTAIEGIPDDRMVGFEVVDLDGNILEPSWMATE